MDTCFSCFKQYFAKGQHFTYDLDDIARYYNDYVRLMAYWKKLFPEEIFTINYEQVIENPNDRIRDLLEFCNVKFEDSCINFHKSKRPVKTASSEQVRQPINKKRTTNINESNANTIATCCLDPKPRTGCLAAPPLMCLEVLVGTHAGSHPRLLSTQTPSTQQQ